MSYIIYPKLNIFLKIIGHDGSYHQLCSRFVLAKGALYDEMELSKSQSFTLKGDFGCDMEENLIFKAKCALKAYLLAHTKEAERLESLRVEVQKSIPKGAGLGGGSANAGVFLRAVNEFLALGLKESELLAIARDIGADVSFFASGESSANVSGRGEQIEPFIESPLFYEIYTPPIFCDSTKVYQRYATLIKERCISYSNPPQEWLSSQSAHLLSLGIPKEEMNDLFSPAIALYPALKDIASELGSEWYFSGSGSSFFRLRA